jgi:hypothetical protein
MCHYDVISDMMYLDEHFYPCSGSGADDNFSPLVINVPLTPVISTTLLFIYYLKNTVCRSSRGFGTLRLDQS